MRTHTNGSHTLGLLNFTINLLAEGDRVRRGKGLNRYLHRNTYVDIRGRGKSTRASNKSGRVSLHTFHPAFSPTAAALFASPPSLCPLLSSKGYKLPLCFLFSSRVPLYPVFKSPEGSYRVNKHILHFIAVT